MVQQIRTHQTAHMPSGSDPLPWAGDPANGVLGVHMIGLTADMPTPSLGTQAGSDGAASGTAFTAASGVFVSGNTGNTIKITDTGASPPVVYSFTVTFVSTTALTLSSAWAGTGTTALPWVLSGQGPSNKGLLYLATDGSGGGGTGSAGGYQFNTGTYGADNIGDASLIEYTGTNAIGFGATGPTAANLGPTTEYGLAVRAAAGILLTGNVDTDFNTGNAIVTINDYKNTGNYGAFTLQLYAKDGTAGGNQPVSALDATAIGASSSDVECLIGSASNTGNGAAIGVEGLGFNNGSGATGIEIGGLFEVGGGQTGSRSLTILCKNTTGSTTFAVRREGTLLAPLLPTSSAGLPSGALWNNSNVVNVVP